MPKRLEIEIGDIFGIYTIPDINFTERPNGSGVFKKRIITAICKCGEIIIDENSSKILHRNKYCRHSDNILPKTEEGYSRHYLYIITRCLVKKSPHYKKYGAQGIEVCDEWLHSISSFIEWCESNGYDKLLHIDRIDNDKGYSPDNCRFITSRENRLNQRLLTTANKSGYQGISYHASTRKWINQIPTTGKRVRRSFHSKQQAVEARNEFIIDNKIEHEYEIQPWRGE